MDGSHSGPDFFLASCEGYALQQPRACHRLKRLAGRGTDAYLLVHVDPPIVGQQHGLGDADIHQVVLATRHAGQSLFPVSEWPLAVHVARAVVAIEDKDGVEADDLELIGWGDIYPTEQAARDGVADLDGEPRGS